MDLQCSLALLNMPQMRGTKAPAHPALQGLENITSDSKQQTLAKRRLAQLAQQYGLGKAMQWTPRNVRHALVVVKWMIS